MTDNALKTPKGQRMTSLEIIKDELARIDEARANAEQGPWKRYAGDYVGFLGQNFFGVYVPPFEDKSEGIHICGDRVTLENAEFIALAANEITNLTSALNLASHVIENLMEERMAFPKIYADESLSEIANILSGGKDGK